jgi:hypothetical protein
VQALFPIPPRGGFKGGIHTKKTGMPIPTTTMQNPMKEKKTKKKLQAEKREQAMIEGIIEGSPDAIGVVVVRLECGCRKMAAVSKDGDPASKIIMYRDNAQSICDKCKEDNGSFMRTKESFMHWIEPAPSEEKQKEINLKVLGSAATSH